VDSQICFISNPKPVPEHLFICLSIEKPNASKPQTLIVLELSRTLTFMRISK
jgi:hypothetical protein